MLFSYLVLVSILAAPATQADSATASADPTARQEAAVFFGTAHDAHSLILLWQLAHDPEADVRQAALDAVWNRCGHESPGICADMLQFFVNDIMTEIHTSARDKLLLFNVGHALQGASKAYKLDLLTRLPSIANLPAVQAGKVLRALGADPDPQVQENAAWLLERTP